MSEISFKEALALAEGMASELQEKGDHNPFKRFKKLGNKSPGGRSGPDQKGDWECSKKGKYVQLCKGVGPDTEGQKKVVRIDPGYKKSYNQQYKAGVASGKFVPGSRSSGKKKKAAKKAKKK